MAGATGGQPFMEEYTLKAYVLVELLAYFRWSDPPKLGSTLVVAVVGRSPFGDSLDAYVKSHKFTKYKIDVVYLPRAASLPPCNAVFICPSERPKAGAILEQAKGKRILTIADDGDLLGKGVMVDLLVKGKFVKIYVNSSLVQSEKLGISADLFMHGYAEDLTKH